MALYNALFGPKDEPDIYYVKLVRDYLKYITVSEYDREETPTVYGNIHKIAFNKSGLGLDFTPLTVLSNYIFNSRKGKKFCRFFSQKKGFHLLLKGEHQGL